MSLAALGAPPSSLTLPVMAPRPDDGPAERLGLAVVGPVMAAYARWLADHARRHDEPLYCLMREGRPIARLVAAVSVPGLAHELWLNRAVTMRAAIADADDHEALLNLLVRSRRQPPNWARAAAELGLAPPRLGGELILQGAVLTAFLAWLGERRQAGRLRHRAGRRRRLLLAHLRAAGALERPRLLLADLGYAGNIQNALLRIFRHEGLGTEVCGLYLVATKGTAWIKALGGQVRGFLVEDGAPDWFARLFARAPEALESCLAQPVSTLRGFDRHGIPRHGPSPLPVGQLAQAAAVQAAAQRYAEGWRLGADGPDPAEAEAARASLARLLALPTAEAVALMGGWRCDDDLGGLRSMPLAGAGDCPDPWGLDRRRMPWPAARARMMGWGDDRLLAAQALAC